jgi:hypothetical protein
MIGNTKKKAFNPASLVNYCNEESDWKFKQSI